MNMRTSIAALVGVALLATVAAAQTPPQGTPPPADAGASPPVGTGLPPEAIEKLVAPIALYPDVLVAQILPASTYAIQIVQAARWLREKPDLSKLGDQPWEAPVLSLCHYPDVLYKMDQDLDWTNALGAAFLDQQKDVLETIQRLRERANKAGMLQTTPQQTIVVERETVRIVPTQENVVYVPTYNPEVIVVDDDDDDDHVWGTVAASALSFGAGMALGAWLDMDCDWHGGCAAFCRPGYWGGWPHRGAVAWGDDWVAGVGPRRGVIAGDDRGVAWGPRGGVAWGENGAAWRRRPGPVPGPYYGGRYSNYSRYSPNRSRASIGNDVNVNRNNINIDRGDNTFARGGDRNRINGGDSNRFNGGDRRPDNNRPGQGYGDRSRMDGGRDSNRRDGGYGSGNSGRGAYDNRGSSYGGSRDRSNYGGNSSAFGDSRGGRQIQRDSSRGRSSRSFSGGGGGGRRR